MARQQYDVYTPENVVDPYAGLGNETGNSNWKDMWASLFGSDRFGGGSYGADWYRNNNWWNTGRSGDWANLFAAGGDPERWNAMSAPNLYNPFTGGIWENTRRVDPLSGEFDPEANDWLSQYFRDIFGDAPGGGGGGGNDDDVGDDVEEPPPTLEDILGDMYGSSERWEEIFKGAPWEYFKQFQHNLPSLWDATQGKFGLDDFLDTGKYTPDALMAAYDEKLGELPSIGDAAVQMLGQENAPRASAPSAGAAAQYGQGAQDLASRAASAQAANAIRGLQESAGLSGAARAAAGSQIAQQAAGSVAGAGAQGYMGGLQALQNIALGNQQSSLSTLLARAEAQQSMDTNNLRAQLEDRAARLGLWTGAVDKQSSMSSMLMQFFWNILNQERDRVASILAGYAARG